MSFSGPIRVFLSVLILFSGLTDGLAAPPSPDPALRGAFGEWALRCESNALAAGEQCVLVQSVAAENKPDVQMVVIILKSPTGGYILRVVVPLGIILPSGLGLKIDNVDIGRTGFLRCLANGCLAEVVMDEGLLARFKTGGSALFVIFTTPEEGVGVPIQLAGFSNGIAKLP
jgi:invasion protein IalB